MGRKNIKTGNYIFLCITALILFFTISCASINDAQRRHYTSKAFTRGENLIAEKDFQGAIQENQKVLSLVIQGPPRDRALFNLAMIYVHYDNSLKDYGKALKLLRQLIQEYPDSPLFEESKNWESVLVRSSQLQSSLWEKTETLNQFVRSKETIAGSNFKESLEANNKILAISNSTLLKDKALYSIALVYAHYKNPDRNYQKALRYFSRLIKEYPDSPYIEEAKVWSSLIKVIEQAKQVDIEIEKKKKEMAR